MKDITKFISDKSHEENLINQFRKLIHKAKTKEEVRELEMRLLRPRPLEHYKGKRPGKSTFKKRCILLTFPSSDIIEQWAKFFKVNTYIENNTYDVDFLIELFALMEKGIFTWDAKKKKYYVNNYQNEKNEIKMKRKIKRRKK